jgi:tetratricopeptide (TPR) repeat protein
MDNLTMFSKLSKPRILGVAVLLLALAGAAFAGAKEDIQADMRAGRWVEADAKLVTVLDKHPDNALAHYWRAQVKARQGERDEARRDLAEAKRLDPALKFAADKAVLSHLERELTALPSAPTARPAEAVPRAAALPAVPLPREPDLASGGSGFSWTPIALALLALVALIVWATRYAKRREIDAERERMRALLQEADNELRDAAKAVDARAELSMEQRLALSDRALRAQGDIASHLATLGSRSDFASSHELLRRVKDIAADVRGEERPSDIEARRAEAEAAARMQGVPLGQPTGMPGGAGLGGSGVGAALGGLAAGVVLGELLSGSGNAHAATQASPRYTPIDEMDGGTSHADERIDVGGSGGDWDDGGGSADTGGGGGDFD